MDGMDDAIRLRYAAAKDGRRAEVGDGRGGRDQQVYAPAHAGGRYFLASGSR